MNRLQLLIDLSNTDVFRGLRRPNPPLIADRVESLVDRALQAVSPLIDQRFLEARFRLYHGWFGSDGSSTDLHALTSAHIRQFYPTRTRACRMLVELAEGPVAQRGSWRIAHTFREEPGLPPTSLKWSDESPAACVDPSRCSGPGLRQWLRGRCPSRSPDCSVALSEVVSHVKQKLVDTLLVSDLVWLAAAGENVAVFSDDEDVLPGLLTASRFPVKVVWICRDGNPRPQYSGLVARAHIGCVAC